MNEAHQFCGSDEWRRIVREHMLPFALGDVGLGDDVLEVGPGYGATTDVLAERCPKLTAVEIDAGLAAALVERFTKMSHVTIVNGDATALGLPDEGFSGAACFTMLHHVATADAQDRLFAEVARVLRPAGTFVAGDSLANPDLEAAHDGDTYNPVDPTQLGDRLAAAGFTAVTVRTNDYGWFATATKE